MEAVEQMRKLWTWGGKKTTSRDDWGKDLWNEMCAFKRFARRPVVVSCEGEVHDI